MQYFRINMRTHKMFLPVAKYLQNTWTFTIHTQTHILITEMMANVLLLTEKIIKNILMTQQKQNVNKRRVYNTC